MSRMEITEALRASFGAAVRKANVSTSIDANAATMAGFLLDLADGDTKRAMQMAEREGPFFSEVRIFLSIAQSEAEDAKRIAGYGNVVRLSARK